MAQQTRLRQPPPSGFGCRIARLRAPGETDRLPVDVAVVRRPGEPDAHPDKALCRLMRPEVRRPAWGQEGVGTAEAAEAASAQLRHAIQLPVIFECQEALRGLGSEGMADVPELLPPSGSKVLLMANIVGVLTDAELLESVCR
jgi:hypothetical protein